MQCRYALLFFVDFSYVSSKTTYFEDVGRGFSQIFLKKANHGGTFDNSKVEKYIKETRKYPS